MKQLVLLHIVTCINVDVFVCLVFKEQFYYVTSWRLNYINKFNIKSQQLFNIKFTILDAFQQQRFILYHFIFFNARTFFVIILSLDFPC